MRAALALWADHVRSLVEGTERKHALSGATVIGQGDLAFEFRRRPARRSFIVGNSVWPPARSLASAFSVAVASVSRR